jgi:uncharacterized protein YchJ
MSIALMTPPKPDHQHGPDCDHDHDDHDHSHQRMEPIRRTEPKIGRNDPCHCGSGRKFKKCHGAQGA